MLFGNPALQCTVWIQVEILYPSWVNARRSQNLPWVNGKQKVLVITKTFLTAKHPYKSLLIGIGKKNMSVPGEGGGPYVHILCMADMATDQRGMPM